MIKRASPMYEALTNAEYWRVNMQSYLTCGEIVSITRTLTTHVANEQP